MPRADQQQKLDTREQHPRITEVIGEVGDDAIPGIQRAKVDNLLDRELLLIEANGPKQGRMGPYWLLIVQDGDDPTVHYSVMASSEAIMDRADRAKDSLPVWIRFTEKTSGATGRTYQTIE